jgi:hypothetical protein
MHSMDNLKKGLTGGVLITLYKLHLFENINQDNVWTKYKGNGRTRMRNMECHNLYCLLGTRSIQEQ